MMKIESIKELTGSLTSQYQWIILSFLMVILIIILLYRHRYFYEKKDYLCSRSEQRFFTQLLSLLPRHYFIHCQTSLIALLKPADIRSARMVWAKRMDFVITDRNTKILLIIELDDKSHEAKDRRKRDKFVNKTLRGKHPLLRISTDQSRDLAFVRNQIKKRLN